MHITIENKELYDTITNQLVDKLFDTIHQSAEINRIIYEYYNEEERK